MKKILDASSVICILKEIEEPPIYHLCEKLNHELYITKEVHEELLRNELTYKKFREFGSIQILKLDFDYSDEIKKLKEKYIWMHDGEASIICVAKILGQDNHCTYSIIDEKARDVAKDMGLLATGTVGLILWEKERVPLEISYLQKIKTKLSNSPFRISGDYLELLISISPKKTLEFLINEGHVENLPSCEECRQIGYKYDSSTNTWEIRGEYDEHCKYSEKTKKVKADDDDTRTKLLEYIYYVDQCSSTFSDENGILLGLSGGLLMVFGGQAGAAGCTIAVGSALIHLNNIGNEMDQCTKYAKEIYKKITQSPVSC